MKQLKTNIRALVCEENGAQVIEYALIIAVISIALVIGLGNLNGNFGTFINRVVNCLTTATCT
jgi:pilus assembly protein Flp/PilA